MISFLELMQDLRTWCRQEELRRVCITIEGRKINIEIQDKPTPGATDESKTSP